MILKGRVAIFAGIKAKPFFEISVEEWDDIIRANLKGIPTDKKLKESGID